MSAYNLSVIHHSRNTLHGQDDNVSLIERVLNGGDKAHAHNCKQCCRKTRRECTNIGMYYFMGSAPWIHQANLTTSPLVACTTASTVQDRCPGLPVSKRPGTVVLGRWLSLVSDVRPRQLRSSTRSCAVRRTRTRTTFGDRCFAVAGPWVWNSLPTELRQSDSLNGDYRPICLDYGTTAPSDCL